MSWLWGQRVDLTSSNSAIAALTDTWVDNVRSVGALRGWYRILGDPNKIGIVATANGLESLYRSSKRVAYEAELWQSLETLSDHRQYWTFISTINDTGVVDATASVLVAIGESIPLGFLPSASLTELKTNALDWLESIARADGGWGLIAGSELRAYSTALAIRALHVNGRTDTAALRAGVDALLNSQRPDSGAWLDAEGRISVPVTAECLRSLALVSTPARPLKDAIASAAAFIIDDGAKTAYWTSETSPGQFEEVAVTVSGNHRRVEHAHTSRAVAVAALAASGYGKSPVVSKAMSEMIDDASAGKWTAYARGRYAKPPSWMLYDVLTALSLYRSEVIGSNVEVWVGRRRFVAHPAGRAWIARRFIEHYPKVLLLVLVVTTYVVLEQLRVFEQPWIAAGIAIVGSVIVNVVSSFVYSLLAKGR